MAAAGAFSWNSELPSGRSPFWIRDEALAGVGLHPGDAVSVDTRAEPRDGDLVVVEVELDGDSQRLARRYAQLRDLDQIRLDPVGGALPPLELPSEQVMVMGVIVGRLRFEEGGARVLEEPISPS